MTAPYEKVLVHADSAQPRPDRMYILVHMHIADSAPFCGWGLETRL